MDHHIDHNDRKDDKENETERTIELGEADGESPADAAGVGRIDLMRKQRLDDLVLSALAMEDPLDANIAAVNAELSGVARYVAKMLTPQVEAAASKPQEFFRLLPAMDVQLRMARQIERLSQFIQRRERERQQDEARRRGHPGRNRATAIHGVERAVASESEEMTF